MRIGVLTGGGDCPGLNPVIRAIVRAASPYGDEIVGLRNGWAGLVNNLPAMELNMTTVTGILHRGGTILGTSRTNPYKDKEALANLKKNWKGLNLDALIAIGGEDTLGVATKLSAEGFPVVGVPKTIDNDLSGTDYTFGFDTAVNIVMEAIDRLHTTAESHHRIMVVEVMGRHAGWIALHAGLAGGADVILLPEFAMTMDEIVSTIQKRHARGKSFSIVVVAEGAQIKGWDLVLKQQKKDSFGHVLLGGISHTLGKEIEKRTGFETRVTELGHIQRGGSPTAFDRVLGTRFGVKAVELVKQKKYGYMVALRGTEIAAVKIADATKKLKVVDKELYKMAQKFFG
ncbi:MAG: 6-phosphofructokinase [Candidatus Omnitrophica bacterium]|jgi:phosphofructokinase-like protein|nr:6-phosphofructokinase [Candidatus Omnitrophota bacterium]